MKILVLSLLRIGDLIMHQHFLQEIQREYPEAQISLLVNDGSQDFAQTLPFQVFIFPRHQMQAALVEKNRNPSKAFLLLRELAQTLNSVKFDYCMDLTHTCLSHKLELALEIPCFEKNEIWSKYFNDQYLDQDKPLFPYLHVLSKTFDRTLAPRLNPKLNPKTRGLSSDRQKRVFFQTQTSDAKKNWPVEKWRNLAKYLKQEQDFSAGWEVLVLAAPFELDELQQTYGKDVPVVSASWQDLPDLMTSSDLLVSGDTSLLHWAAYQQIPAVGIFLGSANFFKTLPWNPETRVVASKVPCAPCAHSVPCAQPSHLCSQSISVEVVGQQVLEQLGLASSEIAKDKVEIWSTYQGPHDQFIGLRKAGGHFMENACRAFEIGLWQIHLDSRQAKSADVAHHLPLGSLAHHLIQEQSEFWISPLGQNLLKQRSELQDKDAEICAHLLQIYTRVSRDEVQTLIKDHCVESTPKNEEILRTQADFFYPILKVLQTPAEGFMGLNSLRSALNETESLLSLEGKLLRNLIQETKERGFAYVTGSGKTFENSFAAPRAGI
jgi:ADP-heptose:LPS heptosyltransferase